MVDMIYYAGGNPQPCCVDFVCPLVLPWDYALFKWKDTTPLRTSVSTGTSPPIFPLGQTRFCVYLGDQRVSPSD